MFALDNPRRTRRITAGVGLIGFPLLLLVAEAVEPATELTPAGPLLAAAAHPGRMLAATALLLLSAILTVPAVYGVVHQIRDRGVTLAHVAGALGVLGALGHTAIATHDIVVLSMPAGDRAEMIALLERLDSSGAVGLVFPLILSFALGVVLLAVAAWRAGLVAAWAPAVMGVALVIELVGGAGQVQGMAKQACTLAVFGYLGLRALRMGDDAWTAPTLPAAAAQPTPARP